MSSLWFVMPVHGRLNLTAICLRQLRITCDELIKQQINATAVVIGNDENLETAFELGFGTVERANHATSKKYNDGIQLACAAQNESKECGVFQVVDKRDYRGHKQGDVFTAALEKKAERRAIERGSIERLDTIHVAVGDYYLPRGWQEGQAADYVVPIGSDDWVDYRILLELPKRHTIYGFQRLSFVRPDGLEMVQRFVNVRGGCGIRIYPRQVFEAVGYRPADEDRKRACDTSILTNIWRASRPNVAHRELDPRQIVDWKSADLQLNPYESLTFHRIFAKPQDPFKALVGMYPRESLDAMARHYEAQRRPHGESRNRDSRFSVSVPQA